MDDRKIQNQLFETLTQKVSTLHLQMFFRHAQLRSSQSGMVELRVGSAYAQQIISQRYQGLVADVLETIMGGRPQLRVVLDPSILPTQLAEPSGPLFTDKQQSMTTSPSLLRKDFTFETFAVASSNQLANAAAQAVAKSPGTSYNPLFLYGGTGVGKTHLMQAIGNAILTMSPSARIMYCSGEDFTNELISSIQARSTGVFKRRYRNANLLLVDDVHFIAGKNAVQEEFFNTFNAILRSGNQIILTADQAPREIQKLEARLRSRFEAGMIADLLPPDFELRTAILLIKAKNIGVPIEMITAQTIAARAESVRQMEGIFNQLLVVAALHHVPLNVDLVQKHLQKTAQVQEKKDILRPEVILDAVLSYYHLTLPQLESKKRDRLFVRPRQMAMYLIRKELNLPFKAIGELLGGRDHTTILHGVQHIHQLLQSRGDLGDDLARIRQRLFPG
ncbi:MAG: chromosomal replication initiator protein DnaA [bacterium]|nr:chromosomal replication initiator protein DnaA [bacterium]